MSCNLHLNPEKNYKSCGDCAVYYLDFLTHMWSRTSFIASSATLTEETFKNIRLVMEKELYKKDE